MMHIQKAIIKKNDKYLTLLRSKTAKFFPDHWDFPGGKLDKDEQPINGIIREAKEEVNLDIIPKEVIGIYPMDIDGIPHTFTIYSIESYSGEIKISKEHQEFRWQTKEELLALIHEPFIDKYFNAS